MQQTFHTKFTADASSVKRTMQDLKQRTSDTIKSVRGLLIGLSSLGGLSGIGLATVKMVKLGGEAQNTQTAFEVMMGSVSKAQQILAQLNDFADYTPFDNDEVIKSGRMLLNIGTATDQLNKRLAILGNIAAGNQMPLQDMVAIYAKAANKGKVQAEELAQLSERGIPILASLSSMLGVSTEEIMNLGSKGKLSFALLDEALSALGGKGGQYFGLMEKQSQNMLGKWDGVRISLRKIAQDIGTGVIPAVTDILDDFQAKIDELRKTGELDATIKSVTQTLSKTLLVLRDLAKWMTDNKAIFLAMSKIAIYWFVWKKINVILLSLNSALKGTTLALDPMNRKLRHTSASYKILTADIGNLCKATGLIRTSLMSIGAVAATAWTGWEVGKIIAQVTGLDKALQDLYLRRMAPNANPEGDNPVKASVQSVDLAASKRRLAEIAKERKSLDQTPGASARSEKLDAEAKEIEASVKKYEESAKNAEVRRNQLNKRLHEMRKEKAQLQKNADDAYAKHIEAESANGAVFVTPRAEFKGSEQRQLENYLKRYSRLADEFRSVTKTHNEYVANQKRANAQEEKSKKDNAEAVSAAEKFKQERATELAKKRQEMEQQLAAERKKLNKAKESLKDEKFHDNMTAQITKWRENIKGYQAEIDKTEQLLSKLGLSVDEDILKTPEQIKQQKTDEILKTKINANNRGETVHFTEEESKRIKDLKSMQDAARKAKDNTKKIESSITAGEQSIQTRETAAKSAEQADKATAIAAKEKALNAANLQFDAAKKANADVEKLLGNIGEILKKGLPDESF